MFLALFGAVGAQAEQTWTEPTLNFKTFADGDTVYFYNVKTGMFLTEGNAYGTQTSLGAEGTPFAPLKQDDGSYLMLNKAAKSNGTKTTTGWSKMFADNYTTYPGASYVDEGSQGHDHWIFYPKADNILEISLDTTLTRDLGTTRLGWNGGSNTVVYPILEMANDTASKYGVEWKAVSYKDPSVALFIARTALSAEMKLAQTASVNFDSYLSLYNNTSATAEELTTAYKTLKTTVDNYSLNGASDENPKDATSFITASNCGVLTGWTAVSSANNWQTQSASYTNGTVTINGFIERWIASNSKLSDAKIYQTITGLPNGSYQLGADFIATQQGNAQDAETGTYLFAYSGSTKDSTNISTGNNAPEHATVSIVVTDNTLTFGFEQLSTTCNWVGMDNYTLTYYGNGTGTLKTTLKTNIDAAATVAEQAMNENVLNTLSEVISNATNVYQTADATADQITAQISALGTAVKAAKDNVAAYVAFKAAIDSADNTVATLDPKKYDVTTLSDFMGNGNYSDAYDGYTYSTAQCTEATAAIMKQIKACIYSGIKEGGDITFVINNPNFTTNANGWSGTTPAASYKVGEVYNVTFDTYQTLTDLPLGKYTLKVQAYTRTQSNAKAYTNFIAGTEKVRTMIYANNATDTIKNIMAEAQATSLMDDSLNVTTHVNSYPNDFLNDGGTYTPNSMQGGYYYFAAGLYDNTVSTVVTDGTLKIGIKLSDKTGYSDFWTLFDNFRLTYDGKSIETLSGLRDANIAKAEALYAKPMCSDSLNALKTIITTAKAETDGEKLLTELSDMAKCMTAANNSIATYANLTSYMTYSKQITDSLKRTAGAADYTTAYNAIEANIAAGTYKDTEIAEAIITAKKATCKYLMSDITTEAKTDGVDVTYVIQNSDFAKNTSTGWDITTSDAAYKGAANYQCFEIFNRKFNVSQTLYNMPQGTYKLTTQAYYRDGTNAGLVDSVANNKYGLNAKIYINDATGNVMPITDGATDTTGTKCPAGLYLYNGDSKLYTPNTMQTAAFFFDSLAVGQKYIANDTYNFVTTEVKSDANGILTIGAKKDVLVGDDWTIFGGFKLYYYGTSSGINDIANGNNASVVNSKFYGVNGAQSSKLLKGINIVKSTMSDGTVKVQKVIVK